MASKSVSQSASQSSVTSQRPHLGAEVIQSFSPSIRAYISHRLSVTGQRPHLGLGAECRSGVALLRERGAGGVQLAARRVAGGAEGLRAGALAGQCLGGGREMRGSNAMEQNRKYNRRPRQGKGALKYEMK